MTKRRQPGVRTKHMVCYTIDMHVLNAFNAIADERAINRSFLIQSLLMKWMESNTTKKRK